ncbi:MAG: acyl-CoA synthetase [Candidatus Dojkabacteria bacterium]|nr:MAG: acyl-CoA synthetase [Candidatus Dojkabacteria bacterium]
MYTKDLSKFFTPKSVAIIGASRDSKKVGRIIFENLLDWNFKGEIYLVNPNVREILGYKCFADYSLLPVVPDLAVIAIPASFVIDTMHQIGRKGTKHVIIISAGFRESGEEGKILEKSLIETAELYGIHIIGPNCLGVVSVEGNLNATFGSVSKYDGNLRFLSQSGAVATSFFDFAASQNLGFSHFVTLGNKANISEVDVLTYWFEERQKKNFTNDPNLSTNRPIGIYLEAIDDGISFINIAAQISLHDPIFILKPGKSQIGKKAMQSHTGSLAGEDSVLDAALKDAGIIRCEGLEDFFDLAKAFSWEEPPEGSGIAIISNAGGPAVVATDFIEKEGLRLAELSNSTLQRLKRALPEGASIHNPIDVLGDALAMRYFEALDAVLSQEDVYAAIVILTPQVMTEGYLTAEIIARLSDQHRKPILCSFMGGSHIVEAEKILNLHKIPNFRYPERAIRALGKMWQWRFTSVKRSLAIQSLSTGILNQDVSSINFDAVNDLIEIGKKDPSARIDNSRNFVLNSFLTDGIFDACGIKNPPSSPVNDIEDCFNFVQEHGSPVVLKLISPHLMHKTEYHAVKTGLYDPDQIRTAFNKLKNLAAKLEKKHGFHAVIQIQKQVMNGVELILGIKRDTSFGHVMMFGGGGIMADILQDVNLKLLPIDRFNAVELVENSKVYKLLAGFRGMKPYPVRKLFIVMERLSDLVLNFPEIAEIEVNPLILTYEDIWAVDGKAIVTET